MTNEHRVSYNGGCKRVLGKGSCCIYQMAFLPYATFSYGECTTFSQQLRKKKRQQRKPWEKLSLLLANIKQHLGTHRLWSNILGTLELPNLWSLSFQSRELRFSGMSFQPIEVPHNIGKRVARTTRLPNPSCWCCSRASIPHIILWCLENTLQPHCRGASPVRRAHASTLEVGNLVVWQRP